MFLAAAAAAAVATADKTNNYPADDGIPGKRVGGGRGNADDKVATAAAQLIIEMHSNTRWRFD